MTTPTDPTQEQVIARLRERIQTAEALLSGYQRKDPNDFAYNMAAASMQFHIDDLKTQLKREEAR